MKERLRIFLQDTGISGESAAILNSKTSLFFEGVMGVETPYSEIPVRDEMQYDIASLTKVVGTTMRIFQMIQTKKLSFETKCCEVLTQDPQLTMTIEELLLHTSGLPADFENKAHFSADLLDTFLSSFIVPSKKAMVYSDIGYILLGLIIEILDQEDLETSFQKHLFRPLEMKNTSFYPVADQIVPTEVTVNRGVIVGVVHDSKAYQFGRPLGSAGIFSTISDLALFVQSLLRNQFPDGTSLLSEEIYMQLVSRNENGRTLGWEKRFGETVIYHTGFTGTSIGIDLKKKKALILLTNRIHPTRHNDKFIMERTKLYQEFFEERSK